MATKITKIELTRNVERMFPNLSNNDLKQLKTLLQDITESQVRIFIKLSKNYNPIQLAETLVEINRVNYDFYNLNNVNILRSRL